MERDSLLQELIRELPEIKCSENGIDTAKFVREIAEKWPKALDDSEIKQMNILHKKICIAQKVRESYHAGWKKNSQAQLASTPLLLLVAYLYIAYSSDHRAFAWKNLNSAFYVLDMVPDKNNEHFKKLQSWAFEILEKK